MILAPTTKPANCFTFISGLKRYNTSTVIIKPITMATPPIRGIGFLCIPLSFGTSIAPIFTEIFFAKGVVTSVIANALAKAAIYKSQL